jgi:hypothetical protein
LTFISSYGLRTKNRKSTIRAAPFFEIADILRSPLRESAASEAPGPFGARHIRMK